MPENDKSDEASMPSTVTPPAPPSTEPPAFRSSFASISMHKGNRIRLLGFPDSDIARVRSIINTHWPGGVKSARPYHGSHEITLRGSPWSTETADELHSKRLLNRVLKVLFDAGWAFHMSTDISQKQCHMIDSETLIFHYQSPPPEPCDWMCISFARGNCLRLVDSPRDFVTSVAQLCTSFGILHSVTSQPIIGCYEVKISGKPWRHGGMEFVRGRKLVMAILGILESQGWVVYASVDQHAENGWSSGCYSGSTWHCTRKQDWSPLPGYEN